MEQVHEEGHNIEEIDVKIKTPAGHQAEFSINTDWTIDKVIKKAEHHFIEKGQLQPGEYNLVLVNADGTTKELVGSSKVEDYNIPDEAELDLVVAGPQVDG